MTYKEVYEKAEAKDKTLRVGDGFEKIVVVRHGDGTTCEFHYAFWEKMDSDWFVIYTEHNGFHVYSFDDTLWIKELTENYVYLHADADIYC